MKIHLRTDFAVLDAIEDYRLAGDLLNRLGDVEDVRGASAAAQLIQARAAIRNGLNALEESHVSSNPMKSRQVMIIDNGPDDLCFGEHHEYEGLAQLIDGWQSGCDTSVMLDGRYVSIGIREDAS